MFIRFNEGLSILKKVVAVETGQSDSLSLPDGQEIRPASQLPKAFRLETPLQGEGRPSHPVTCSITRMAEGVRPERSRITAGTDLIDAWKVFAGYAAPGTGNRDTYPHRIISTPFIGEPGSISSETYLCIGPFFKERRPRVSCPISRVG